MAAFKHFDTSAYLEDARSQPQSLTPATPATPATEFDGKEQTVATVATVAGCHGDNSNSLARCARNAQGEWDPETAALIAWFLGTEPPSRHFELQQAVYVARPGLYWAYLRQNIADGPSRARGKTGALRDDLRRLHQLFGGD